MFKVGKIKQVENEELIIKKTKREKGRFENGKSIYTEMETLSFIILSDDYSFEFSMKEPIDSLLDIPMNEFVNFEKYLFGSDPMFTKKGNTSHLDFPVDIKIYRYLENNYEITIHFNTDDLSKKEEFAGIIIFDFDLDNYLDT